MALAYLTINLDAFTGDDHPPISQYSTITLDPGADHIDAAADVIHVRSVVVSLDQQGKAATANGVPCVDGKVPIVAGVMYAVSAPNVLRDGPHYIPALTAGQVVDLSDYITPGAPLTPDQAATLTARIVALETTPPGGGAVDSVNGQVGAVVLDAADVGAATAADLEGKADARMPLPGSGVPVSVYDAATNVPYWLGRDRRTIYRGGSSTLKTSTDDGATWVTATTFAFTPYIVGVRDLDNGEVIVATAASGGTPGKLYVSSGFGTPGVTWTKKLDAGDGGVGPTSYFSGDWGMSTHENIVVVSEYGIQNPPTDSARFVYLSQDYGVTWEQIFDLGTSPTSHIHAAFYDPWWKAIWVANGDSTNRAVRVSFDMGDTWTIVANPDNTQVVGGIAMPGCILFGTDFQPDGIYRVARTPDRSGLTLESAYHLAGGATDRRRFIGGMPFWTGRQGDPVLFPFISDVTWTDSGRLVATLDGYSFTQIWADTQTYEHAGLWKAIGPTVTGTYLGELEDDRPGVKSTLKLSYVPPLRASVASTASSYLTGRAGSGPYTTGDVIEVGGYASNTRSSVGTSLVAGGSPNYENVVGGNLANVDTPTSNLTGVPTLTGEDGNWNFLLGGYDTVVNGWANAVVGFHSKIPAGVNHCVIAGGSRHTMQTGASYGTASGGTGHVIGGASATVSGGTTNTATGNNSTVGGGNSNSATAPASTISGGSTNTASGNNSSIVGGNSNTASGLSSTVVGGQTNTASGIGAAVPGGRSNTAAGDYSTARGYGAVTTHYGEDAHAALPFSTPGDAQTSRIIAFRQTTDATASDLRVNNASPPLCPENTTWAFRAQVVARRTDVDGENAAWEVTGTYKRDAGNTGALVGTPVVTSLGANGGNTWTLAVGSYSTGNLRLIVTGEAAKTIRWVGVYDITQVQG